MTVKPIMDDPSDQFPIGMRVLAVDDDHTCLFLLETLLRRCKYHVTTTSQAITALKMLRENKNKFDLVISDVHMPDMDGFKLLELVGLEMDLPVIMLSGNGDSKLVMKGITHGACDYLLKPVRIEELKNIWQHVIRRKRFDPKDKNNLENQDSVNTGTGEGGQIFAGNSDMVGKFNRKRKDQDEDDVDENDGTEHDNDDPATQKKPRVVWSVELHRKFVSAVNHLGIEKAVPKKILDLMNVEKLTRENVASHLQKYRLYLKRISCVANQQANMVAALGSTDSPYLRMGSLNGLANYPNFSGSGQLQTTAFKSFPSSGMIGRLNTPAGLGMCGLPSSGIIQLGHGQNSSSFTEGPGKFQPVILHGNHNGSILQGMPASIELDRLQNDKGVTCIRGPSTAIDNKAVFPVSSGFPTANITVDNSSEPRLGFISNPLMLEGHPVDAPGGRNYGNQSSATVRSLNSELSSQLLDHRRCDGNWSSSVQSSGFQSNSFQMKDCLRPVTLRSSNMRDATSTMTLQFGSNSGDIASINPMLSQLRDSRSDLQCQPGLLSGNGGLNINNATQGMGDHKPNAPYQSNILCSSENSVVPADSALGSLGQNLNLNSSNFHGKMDFNLIGQSNHVNTLSMNRNELERSAIGTSLTMNGGYPGQAKAHESYVSTNLGSLEDLVSGMMKQEEGNVKVMKGDLGSEGYSPRDLHMKLKVTAES